MNLIMERCNAKIQRVGVKRFIGIDRVNCCRRKTSLVLKNRNYEEWGEELIIPNLFLV